MLPVLIPFVELSIIFNTQTGRIINAFTNLQSSNIVLKNDIEEHNTSDLNLKNIK